MRGYNDLNEVLISGRLTKDPEFREIPNGFAVLDFYLACNRYLRREGEEPEQLTTFVKVSVWNKRAEHYSEVLQRGDEVLVRGQLVDDNFNHEGKMTSGRLKLDNITFIKIIRFHNEKTQTETEEVEVE